MRAAESKQATEIVVLDLTGITSFADYFVICTGANQRQVQAIADQVGLEIKRRANEQPLSLEGYTQAEWVLADYGDLLVHVFSPKAREYYSLERLWRGAKIRRDSRRVKIFLYFIGKPKDAATNGIAGEFLKRSGRYCSVEMREIRPERTDLWARHPAARKILLDPAGKSMDSAAFTALIAKIRDGRPRPGLRGGRPRGPPGRLGGARRPAAFAFRDDVSARTGARHAGRADLPRAGHLAGPSLPAIR